MQALCKSVQALACKFLLQAYNLPLPKQKRKVDLVATLQDGLAIHYAVCDISGEAQESGIEGAADDGCGSDVDDEAEEDSEY